jgi:NAD(P)-dependent dehydrogenase (short-subunit alcohol dehydrogenase family)
MPRIIVVTGSSGGIGRASAIAFGARGDTVVLVARGGRGLAGAAGQVERAGGTAHVMPADVADPDQVFAVAEKVEADIGPIDVWVNVAFTSVFSPFDQIKPEEYRRVTEVSYLGYVYGTMAALKHMKPRNRGTIVQVGSALAYRGIPLQSAYCGAKHAIQGFHEALRCELLHDKSGVHVTMVQMPAVNTPQFSWVLSRLPRHAQPVPPIYQPSFAARGVLFAWTATWARPVSSPSRPISVTTPTPRSTCGSRPTATTATTSARTVCSTRNPTTVIRSCGHRTTMAWSACPSRASPQPRSQDSSVAGGDRTGPEGCREVRNLLRLLRGLLGTTSRMTRGYRPSEVATARTCFADASSNVSSWADIGTSRTAATPRRLTTVGKDRQTSDSPR